MRKSNSLIGSSFRNHRYWGKLLMAVVLMVAHAGCGSEVPLSQFRVRKNVKDLTAKEKQDLVAAILELKSTPPPAGITEIRIADQTTILVPNYYDMFVAFHQAAVVESLKNPDDEYGVAHKSPVFPPWHRKLLLMYENALRDVSGKDIVLPYWDWTDPESTDAVFSPDFMGSYGDPSCSPGCPYAVVDGPFSKDNWRVELCTKMEGFQLKHPWTWLVRAVGRYEGLPYPVALPMESEIAELMTVESYDVAPYDKTVDRSLSFRNHLEGFHSDDRQYLHNIVHDWVAGAWMDGGVAFVGTMEPLDISPSDPVFFLHHANVDRIWAQWQLFEPGRMDAYEPVSGGRDGSNRDDEMFPFNLFVDAPEVGADITPGSMLDFEALGFSYADLVQPDDNP